MSPAQLLTHFDRISEAPDAIPRLRRFILDLAVRGRLVEQDPRDEPASELLKRIQAEKERLVKADEIRKEKPFPRVEDDETPFALPAGWEWVRIRQVTRDRGQSIPTKDFTYIDVTAINKEVGCIGDAKVVSASNAPSRARKLVLKGDVLYSCVRPYLLNIAVIESEIAPPPIASTAFAVLNGFGLVLSKYLWIALRSPFMVECVEGKMRGQAYPAINDSDFALLPLPLPPLAEQQRIVAKVDELMALCDRLEAAQAERESRRDRLAVSSLSLLNNGVDADAFRKHARFTLDNFPRFTMRLEHIRLLRQTILNLAVRGKLVPQDHNDESATELLRQIQVKKARLVNEGQIKKQPPLPPLLPEEIPFHLTEQWQWLRLGEIGLTQTGTTPSSNNPEHFGDYIPFVKPAALTGNTIDYSGVGITKDGIEHSRLIPKHSVLMVCIGSSIGKVNVTDRDVCCNQQINAVTPYLEHLTKFTSFALKADYFQKLVLASAGMGTLPIISKGKWEILQIPLPPLAEQQRIVAKVDELMALCDRLEAQLTTTQAESRRLLEAVLRDVLAGQSELEQSVLQ